MPPRLAWQATPRPRPARRSARLASQSRQTGCRDGQTTAHSRARGENKPRRQPNRCREKPRDRRSLRMHPTPAGIAADCKPDEEQRRRQKNAGAEPAIEPAAEESEEQRRHDDDPSQHADLGKLAAEGRLALLLPAALALAAPVHGAKQFVVFRRHDENSVPASGARPLRSARKIWRMACICSFRLATRACCSASNSARKRTSTACSNCSRSSPSSASRVATATSFPPCTESTPRRTAQ